MKGTKRDPVTVHEPGVGERRPYDTRPDARALFRSRGRKAVAASNDVAATRPRARLQPFLIRALCCSLVALAIACSTACGDTSATEAGPIRAWQVCGPFAVEGVAAPATASEGDLSPRAREAVEGRAWKDVAAKNGTVNLKEVVGAASSDEACAYAHAVLRADRETSRWISVRSDDGVAVWCNGRRVLVHDVLRGLDAGPDRILLRLREGENDLLLKIFNAGGDWGFSVRLDPG